MQTWQSFLLHICHYSKLKIVAFLRGKFMKYSRTAWFQGILSTRVCAYILNAATYMYVKYVYAIKNC